MTTREASRRFHFLREIASGGFGSVFLTKVMHADGFSRLAAVKLLHRRWSENEEIARRMRDEARLLGWLRHRNLVDVVDLTSIDGRAAVVMEYLEAIDLKFIVQELAARGEMVPAKVVLEVMAAVSSALDAAYNRPPYPGEKPLRVIHRDIKPSNIMIDDVGLVKVLDFGVARADFESRESHTRELQFGSVDYMPPERLFFEPETPASDVYSLGASTFELLVLEKLGKARGRPQKHARFLVDRMSYLRAALPLPSAAAQELEQLLVDCLAYEHSDRPSASDVYTRARALARKIEGPDLREWSEQVVPPLVRAFEALPREANPLVDQILIEDSVALADEGVPRRMTEIPDVPRTDARWEALRQAALEELKPGGRERGSAPTLAPELPPPLFPGAQRIVPKATDGPDGNPSQGPSSPRAVDTAEPMSVPVPQAPLPPPVAVLPPPAPPPKPPLFQDSPDPSLVATRIDGADDHHDWGGFEPSIDDWGDIPTRIDLNPIQPPLPPPPAPPPPAAARPVAPAAPPPAPPPPAPPPPAPPPPAPPPPAPPPPPPAPPPPAPPPPAPPPPAPPPTPPPSRPQVSSATLTPVPSVMSSVSSPTLAPFGPTSGDGDDEESDAATMVAVADISGLRRAGPPTVFPESPSIGDPLPVWPPQEESPPEPEEEEEEEQEEVEAGGGGRGLGLLAYVVLGLAVLSTTVCLGSVFVFGDELKARFGGATAQAPVEVPAVTPPKAPEAPTAAAEPTGPHITFRSLAPGTRKLTVNCAGKEAKGVEVAYLEVEAADKCQVTAYMEDKSRLTEIVTDASAGEYRCFAGGEKRCER